MSLLLSLSFTVINWTCWLVYLLMLLLPLPLPPLLLLLLLLRLMLLVVAAAAEFPNHTFFYFITTHPRHYHANKFT